MSFKSKLRYELTTRLNLKSQLPKNYVNFVEREKYESYLWKELIDEIWQPICVSIDHINL